MDTIGITFRNRVTAAELRGFVDTVGQLRRKNGTPIPDNVDLGRTVVVGTVPGLAVAAVRTLNATLRGRTEVANIHAVYRVGTEKESMITDIISVVVDAGRPEQAVLDLFEADGLEILWRSDYRGIGTVGYRVVVTETARATTGENALGIANRYHEHPLIREAAPNFAPLYQVMSDGEGEGEHGRADPDDDYYTDPINSPGDYRWYYEQVNAAEAWGLVYGSGFGQLGAYDKKVIALMDNGMGLDYSAHSTPGTDYLIDVGETWMITGHGDLVGNQWENTEELGGEGEGEVDDDGNGYIDDFYGWDFVGIDPTTLYNEGAGEPPIGDAVPFPDYYNNPMFNSIRAHGTAAGRAAAVTNNADGISGYCPSCAIMPIRYHINTYDPNDGTYGSIDVFYHGRAELAFNYASGHNIDTGQNVDTRADVIGAMIALDVYDPLVYTAVKQARANGCVVVCPAANEKRSLDAYPLFPQVWPEVITVGGSNNDKKRYVAPGGGGSNYGWSMDILAPAMPTTGEHNIMSHFWDENQYSIGGGCCTSVSMPQLAGLAGLLLTVDPMLSPTEVQVIIQETASHNGQRNYDEAFGVMDMEAAVIDVKCTFRNYFTVADSSREDLFRSVMSVDDNGRLVIDGRIQILATESELNSTGTEAFIETGPGQLVWYDDLLNPTKVVARLEASTTDEFGNFRWPTLYLEGDYQHNLGAGIGMCPDEALCIGSQSAPEAYITNEGDLRVRGLIHQGDNLDDLPNISVAFQVYHVYPPNGIQSRIDDTWFPARDGDIIIAHPGIYDPIDFKGNDIVIRSTDPYDPGVVASTVIDAGGSGSVVTFNGSETGDAALIGFTIRGGTGTLVAGFRLGGGVYSAQSDGHGTKARILYNVIIDNTAKAGGGIFAVDGLISGNTIGRLGQGNKADIKGGGLFACGGVIRKNVIRYNESLGIGNGGYEGGGAMCDCNGFIVQNFIANNEAKGPNGDSDGGALYDCVGLVSGNIFYRNKCTRYGGGLYGCNGTIEQNTVYENESTYSHLGTGISESHPPLGKFRNNIIWGNKKGTNTLYQLDDTTTPTYSCIENGDTLNNNIDSDPSFVSPTLEDVTIFSDDFDDGDYADWSDDAGTWNLTDSTPPFPLSLRKENVGSEGTMSHAHDADDFELWFYFMSETVGEGQGQPDWKRQGTVYFRHEDVSQSTQRAALTIRPLGQGELWRINLWEWTASGGQVGVVENVNVLMEDDAWYSIHLKAKGPSVEVWMGPVDGEMIQILATNAAAAWASVYGNTLGVLANYPEDFPRIVIAILDTGIAMNYDKSEGPNPDGHYELGGVFPWDLVGHGDLNPNQWLNTEEIMNGSDSDSNGYKDDYYGWDFVGADPTEFDEANPGDPIPFPDQYDNPIFNKNRKHGTGAAGRAAAATNNERDVAGMCPSALIMPVRYHVNTYRIGDTYGSADVFYVGRSEYAINYASGHVMGSGANVDTKADVIALMMAIETYDPLIHTAIKQARANGCVIVIPAGNNNESLDAFPLFPPAWPEVITVGATDRDGLRSEFIYNSHAANYGWALDLTAPAARYDGTPTWGTGWSDDGSGPGNGYHGVSGEGTSTTMPQVAGLAALLLTVDPTLSPTDVHVIMRKTATDWLADGRDADTGFGTINMGDAVLDATITGGEHRYYFGIDDSSRETGFRSIMSTDQNGRVILDGHLRRFASGSELAWTSTTAQIEIYGSVTVNGAVQTGDFLYTSVNGIVARLDSAMEDGFGNFIWPNLYLKGYRYFDQGQLSPPSGSWVIGPTGNPDAYIDPNGNLYCKGRLHYQSNFDTQTDEGLLGKHWFAYTYPGIQYVINLADDGDVIVVNPGVHPPINFNGKNIVIRSTDPYDSAVVAATIIDAGGSGTAVTMSAAVDADGALIGFTIRGGSTNHGGGIRGYGTTARILNNVIVGNTVSGDGAAIHNCDGLIEANTIGHVRSTQYIGLPWRGIGLLRWNYPQEFHSLQ